MADNPYELLGLSKEASEADIKASYRKLAKKYHPDLNPGKEAEAKFKTISAAYTLLSDKNKRASFDRGEIDMNGQPTQQRFYRDHAQGAQGTRYYNFNDAAGGFSASGFDASGMDDLFGSFFRGKGFGSRRQAKEENDVRYQLDIEFLEAALGGAKRLTLPDGRTLDVTIPEGVEDGQQLRLKGQGNKGGDAYIEVHIRPHPQFTREGQAISIEIPIGFHESILGSRIEVPTIHGPVEMTVPKGASSGAKLRLKGKGIKGGDQFVKLTIVMPPTIDAELEQITRVWAEKHGYNPRKAREKAQ